MEKENKFIHNLTRLTGPTNTVTVDFMFDILYYINNHDIDEAQFIESAYLESIFDDEEFIQQSGIHICSIHLLFNKYDKAKITNDDKFLTLLHKKHKQARTFLDNEEMKQQIRCLITTRKTAMENKAIMTTVTDILGLLKHFPNGKHAQILTPLLPQLLQTVSEISDENQ